MGPRACLDGRKISSLPGFDLGLSSPLSVVTPTELPGQHLYVNYLILSRRKFGLQEEVKAFLSLALQHGRRVANREPRVFPRVLVVWCWVSCYFRRVLRIVKSYYQLGHVCTSVRMEPLGHPLD